VLHPFTAYVGGQDDSEFLTADHEWNDFTKVKEHATVEAETPLLLPPSIRGVALGLSARCVGSPIEDFEGERHLSGALCIVFDSESLGFAGALARVFKRVAVLNFSSSYSDYENPVQFNVINSSLLVSMTAPHDIVMTDLIIETPGLG
jgi:hypothetical protein